MSTNNNKRKRTNTAGDDDNAKTASSSNPYVARPDTSLPLAWVREIGRLPQDVQNPPPNVVKHLLELYKAGLTDFGASQRALQKALTLERKFEGQVAKDGIPPFIANLLKGPVFQFPDPIKGEVTDRVDYIEAQTDYNKALSDAATAAVKYTRACHSATVALSHERVNVETCTTSLLESMTAYVTEIIAGTGRGTTTQWNAYLSAVSKAYSSDLDSASYDFTASQLHASSTRDAKTAAVAAARHDAELKEATKPVGKIIDEKLVDVTSRLEALEKSRTKDTEPGKKKQKTDAPKPKSKPTQKKTKDSSQSEPAKPAPKGKEKGKSKAKSVESVNEEGEERKGKGKKSEKTGKEKPKAKTHSKTLTSEDENEAE